MSDGFRISRQAVLVLQVFLAAPRQWRHGYDISRETGLKSGSLYPILMRMEDFDMLESSWETPTGGRPPRHLYRLTAAGARTARSLVREHAARHAAQPRLREAEG